MSKRVTTPRRFAVPKRAQRPLAYGEAALLRSFQRIFGEPHEPSGVTCGIGDDAAVLRPRTGKSLVWTIDASLENVHFRRHWLSWELVGYRSLMAAASDLAAMGARPIAALSSLELPRGFSLREAERVARGQARAARQLGLTVVGGNLTRAEGVGVHTSVLGEAVRPRLRRGALPGHQLWLVGDVGLARAGLELLQRGQQQNPAIGVARCLKAWREPRALIEDGIALARVASAQIDVSDGLVIDAGRLGERSGVRVILDEVLLRACLKPALKRVAPLLGVELLSFALRGGEDYCLLASGPAKRRPSFARPVGEIATGQGVVLRTAQGHLQPLSLEGYDHLQS